MLRTTLKLLATLTIVSLAPVVSAQQRPGALVAQTAPAGQPSAQPAVPPPVAVPANQAAASAVTSDASETAAASADGAARPLKLAAPALRELSPWSMFLSADILVKAVMIGLALASLATWTIFIAKMIELSLVQRRLRAALGRIADARSLAEAQFALGAKEGVLSALLAAAMREARLSAGISSDAGVKERAASSFAEIVRAEARRIRLGMGVLATIGATSPFVGLFGTVWGIMNSFRGLAQVAQATLGTVAPGIAEALIATAMGLFAAIPAVVAYNRFAGDLKGVAVMTKDKKKYAATGGWGFQFFAGGDPNKPIVTDAAKQCFECHTPKKSQDYVYSTYIP